ncbi:hypothetical protein Vi05172_g1953 [Venturia inaequalis]|nr:hypothetical protein Vi05172_g1953 [Venturia inaequalis]
MKFVSLSTLLFLAVAYVDAKYVTVCTLPANQYTNGKCMTLDGKGTAVNEQLCSDSKPCKRYHNGCVRDKELYKEEWHAHCSG